jgi:hypothetical protein
LFSFEGSTTVIDDYVDLGPLLNSQTTETILLSDVPALIEIPNDLIGDIPDIRVHLPRLEDSGTTPFDTSTVNVDFSIYSVRFFDLLGLDRLPN